MINHPEVPECTYKKERVMKILVFDDKEENRKAAQTQLKSHDVTVVESYDEAQKLLKPRVDYDAVSDDEDALPELDFNVASEEDRKQRQRELDQIKERHTAYHGYDAVLCDLFVPASAQAQASLDHVNESMPIGIFMCLLSAARGKAKYAGLFTDTNHHEHPASACLDAFMENSIESVPFKINGTQVMFTNNTNWITKNEHGQYVKNWSAFLDYLVGYEDRMVDPPQYAVIE